MQMMTQINVDDNTLSADKIAGAIHSANADFLAGFANIEMDDDEDSPKELEMIRFLKWILPTTGRIVTAQSYEKPKEKLKPGEKAGKWIHEDFPSVRLAVQRIVRTDPTLSGGPNPHSRAMYHACASYGEDRWPPKWEGDSSSIKRNAGNVLFLRSLWADIDIKDKEGCHRSTEAAMTALEALIAKLGLPRPWIVSSGKGLHVYFRLDRDLPPAEWRLLAIAFKAACEDVGLLIDPQRATDVASVLRPPGSIWRKEEPYRTVKTIEYADTETSIEQLTEALAPWMENATAELGAMPKHLRDTFGEASNDLSGGGDFPPADANLIADRCQQIGAFRDAGGDVEEPIWYAALGLLKHCVDGETVCQEWSKGCAEFDPAETEAKTAQWKVGPTTCAEFKKLNATGCEGCQFAGKLKSPISLGREELPLSIPADDARTFWIRGNKFVVDSRGVLLEKKTDEGETKQFLVSSEINVLAKARNAGGRDWSRLVEVVDQEGRRHRLVAPMSSMATTQGIASVRAQLAGAGALLSNNQRDADSLRLYITECPTNATFRTVNQAGWAETDEGKRVYVLADGSVIRSTGCSADVLLTRDPVTYPLARGTVEAWRDGVSAMARGNSRLQFAISLALAGPMLRLVNAAPIGAELFGKSSTGKTTSLRAANSVCGPTTDKFIYSWSTTGFGLEQTAAKVSDSFLTMDDTSRAKDGRLMEDAIYTLESGRSKTRGEEFTKQNGGESEWCLSWLATGEKPLESRLSELGVKTAQGGVDVRCIDIPGDAGKGFGVFENIHDHESPAAFSNALAAAARESYGCARIAFIERLVDVPTESLMSLWIECQEAMRTALKLDSVAGQVERVVEKMALIGAAGELATRWGITGWDRGEALRSATICLRAWIRHRGGTGSREAANAVTTISTLILNRSAGGFIHMNCSNCLGSGAVKEKPEFDPVNVANPKGDQRWVCPACRGAGAPAHNNAAKVYGYVKHAPDGAEFYIPKASFVTDFCAGMDPSTVKKELRMAGILHTYTEPKTNKVRYTRRVEIKQLAAGKSEVYVLLSRAMFGAKGATLEPESNGPGEGA